MSDATGAQAPKSSQDDRDRSDFEPQDPQPESGFIDRAERMSVRSSSPTNPRVSDKPENNQEEA